MRGRGIEQEKYAIRGKAAFLLRSGLLFFFFHAMQRAATPLHGIVWMKRGKLEATYADRGAGTLVVESHVAGQVLKVRKGRRPALESSMRISDPPSVNMLIRRCVYVAS